MIRWAQGLYKGQVTCIENSYMNINQLVHPQLLWCLEITIIRDHAQAYQVCSGIRALRQLYPDFFGPLSIYEKANFQTKHSVSEVKKYKDLDCTLKEKAGRHFKKQ